MAEIRLEAAELNEGATLSVPLTKRTLDVIGSTVGLVLLAPAIAAIAVAIRMDSPGPAFFVQERVGKDGRPFCMLKFRTMSDGNCDDIHRDYVTQLIACEDAAPWGDAGSFKINADPRVTRVGRILRRTSLDELPQLFNVMRGDMSLVGPRPPLDYEVDLYTSRHLRRLEVLPGMTGLWQVSGRTSLNFDQMIDLDLEYIDHWSFASDLRILWRTVSVVLSREGAW